MTNTIQWQIKSFKELSLDELYDFLKLRIDVFVVEQTCFYPDLDNADRHPDTRHLLGYTHSKEQTKQLVGYLRILPKGQTYENYISIGRVATTANKRGQGLGHQLMQQALQACQKYFPQQEIKISAQEHLEKYYNQYGFIKISAMYLEDDIPHIAMLKQ
ncbi:MAG: GNAT family N-acetyltransferase [Colwellia sp.]|nr:GNAT family N-acetyltransferase [Colwellia sp.]